MNNLKNKINFKIYFQPLMGDRPLNGNFYKTEVIIGDAPPEKKYSLPGIISLR